MNLPEDRHPLLYVYLNNDEPDRMRTRYLAQGASHVLGKWPEHLTFSWMMGVIALISLLTCFLLAVILLILSSGHHQESIPIVDRCERNEHVIQIVHMKNLEELSVDENATYFVEILTNETNHQDSACSVESYLRHLSFPVFYVIVTPNRSLENLKICLQLEKKYPNFKTITFDFQTFFDRKVYSRFKSKDIKYLSFLAKIVVSWNVGGTVLDPQVKILKDFGSLSSSDETVTIGMYGKDLVLISTKKFCHAYIFDIMKTLTETNNIFQYSELRIIKKAQDRFCYGKTNCTGVEYISSPKICDLNNMNDTCTFLVPKFNPDKPSYGTFSWENICPLVKGLI